MSSNSDLPDDILDAVKVINELRKKTYMSRADRETLNRAKLRIAFWACRNENVAATRENLTYILGADAADIMGAYDKYLQRDDGASSGGGGRDRSGGGQFWGNM